jgi:hypothetical protein
VLQSGAVRGKLDSRLMPSGPRPIFHGLLYVDEKQRNHANIKGGADPLDIYLRCASLCAKSVAYHGHTFRLVTNEARRLETRLQQLGIAIPDILEQEFKLDVPANLPFRTAHYKLELYSFLGSGHLGEHVGVIDVDSVMIAPADFPPLPPGTLLAYDITDQIVTEYGRDRVCSDIEFVSGAHLSECRWFGGEFLFGHMESFRQLAASLLRLWPNYIERIGQLHHVGDEMLVAAAISDGNLELMDAGQLGLVVRWWTARTNFKQMPFDAAARRSILHLPSDKTFLARVADAQYSPAAFITQFRQAAGAKLFRRRLFNGLEFLAGRKRKYVARLS